MKTFKLRDGVKIDCSSNSTRNGFCHRANLYVNGVKECSSVVSYLNRTWERFDFETVLRRILEKSKIVPKDQINSILDKWSKNPDLNGMGALNSIAAIAMMGDIFGKTTKDKNEWKSKMIKAGLGQNANFPDDFDNLSEEEKERRLNGAIGALKS